MRKLDFLSKVNKILKELDRSYRILHLQLGHSLKFKKDIYLIDQAGFGMAKSEKYLKELYKRVDKRPEILK